MAKQTKIPDGLIARLHGKGSMSEILKIERERLLQQSEQEMHRQLAPSAVRPAAPVSATPLPSTPEPQQPLAPVDRALEPAGIASVRPDNAAAAATEPQAEPALVASSVGPGIELPPPPPTPELLPAPRTPQASPGEGMAPPHASPIAISPNHEQDPEAAHATPRVEGLSPLSRIVGDDLSEFGAIVRHSSETISIKALPLPETIEHYYSDVVDATLIFSAQRNLLAAVRRLTLSRRVMTCQITLEVLSAASGIRNLKTLRKWLTDLHQRNYIRYTPLHGDLRGSLVTITPPASLVSTLEQWWKESRKEGQ